VGQVAHNRAATAVLAVMLLAVFQRVSHTFTLRSKFHKVERGRSNPRGETHRLAIPYTVCGQLNGILNCADYLSFYTRSTKIEDKESLNV